MPVAKFTEFKHRKAGIYVISPQPPTDDSIEYKIGRTVQMEKRLNSYHICYNQGFYIYKAIMLNDLYKTKNKEDKAVSIAKTREVEKYLHDLLDPINVKSTTRRFNEWFMSKKGSDEIDKALIKTHEKFKRDTEYPILGFKPSETFYNKFYIDNFEELTVKEPPKELPQDGQKTRSGRVIRSTSKTKFKDMLYIK
jgi:hypothetical protein